MSEFLQLYQIMSKGRKNEYIFAINSHGENILWTTFSLDVSQAVKKLTKLKAKNFVLACKDIYYFSVVFMALLHAGKRIVISPNLGEEKLFFIAKQCNGKIIRNNQAAELIKGNDATVNFSYLDTKKLEFTIYTSGSTGISTPITKPISALEAEILMLHQLWGEYIKTSIFTSSVLHYHAYGLLFQLLWPWSEGLPILLNRITYPEELFRYTDHYKLNFISSPSFLKSYAEIICMGTPPHSLNLITSSGASLSVKIAKKISLVTTNPIIEIYGSTETGIIATKSDLEIEEWTCFQHVTIQNNDQGFLQVKSPYTGQNGWQILGDSIDILENERFILKGRNDRVIKIYEKRISLTELEESCKKISWVRSANAITLNNSERLGCVIELNQEGVDFLFNNQKSTLVQVIKKHLLPSYDLVLLPRRWRFVEHLYYNEMGKVTHEELLKLF